MLVYRVAFFGHRELYDMPRIGERLDGIIAELLRDREYVEFYVGRNGDFDLWSASAVKRAQCVYGHHNSTLTLVLPYHVKDEEYYKEYYDEITVPIGCKTHFKAAIGERNHRMVDNSDLVIAYVEREVGGAYEAIKYAMKKGIPVLNLAETMKKDV